MKHWRSRLNQLSNLTLDVSNMSLKNGARITALANWVFKEAKFLSIPLLYFSSRYWLLYQSADSKDVSLAFSNKVGKRQGILEISLIFRCMDFSEQS